MYHHHYICVNSMLRIMNIVIIFIFYHVHRCYCFSITIAISFIELLLLQQCKRTPPTPESAACSFQNHTALRGIVLGKEGLIKCVLSPGFRTETCFSLPPWFQFNSSSVTMVGSPIRRVERRYLLFVCYDVTPGITLSCAINQISRLQ